MFSGGEEDGEAQRRLNTLALVEDYLEKGDYDSALRLVDGLLIDDPGDADAGRLRALILQDSRWRRVWGWGMALVPGSRMRECCLRGLAGRF